MWSSETCFYFSIYTILLIKTYIPDHANVQTYVGLKTDPTDFAMQIRKVRFLASSAIEPEPFTYPKSDTEFPIKQLKVRLRQSGASRCLDLISHGTLPTSPARRKSSIL